MPEDLETLQPPCRTTAAVRSGRAPQTPQLAISLVTPGTLDWLADDDALAARGKHWARVLDDPELAEWLAAFRLTHLYLGSDFCEHLLPSPRALCVGLEAAHSAGLAFVLVTPVASPQVIRQLGTLLPLLPDSAEIVANDWGVAHFIAKNFSALRCRAGRILCRMIKDPRLAGSEWARQCTHGLDSAHLRAVLDRTGLNQIEMDVPMFAEPEDFSRLPMPKGVHLPFSYVAKGRMCRPGSLSVTGPERFAVGRKCKKECLNFSATTMRPGVTDQWETIHVGNTILSRHSHKMLDVVMQATRTGAIERLIVPGEAL